MNLINLLQWRSGYSGFGSYVKRVIPFIPGRRLQVNHNGLVELIDENEWSTISPPSAKHLTKRMLQKACLLQFAISCKKLLEDSGMNIKDINTIYSPFLDFIWELRSKPQLITCPDLIQSKYRITNKSYLRANIFQPLHVNLATKVITYSKHVADQLICIGVDHSKIEVIPCGIKIHRPRVIKPYSEDFIVIARHDKHKNLEYLIQAVANFYKKKPDWNGVLRIVGKFGSLTKRLNKIIDNHQFHRKVYLLENIDPIELTDLVRKSFVLISPSQEEGFDYPILEAKAEGIPTLISNIGVHKEFHFDTSSFFEIDKAMLSLSTSLIELFDNSLLWNELSLKGFKLAMSMTVDKQASQINEQLYSIY